MAIFPPPQPAPAPTAPLAHDSRPPIATVLVANGGTAPWSGWVRTTVDMPLLVRYGATSQGLKWTAGASHGDEHGDTTTIDMQVTCAPGAQIQVELHADGGLSRPAVTQDHYSSLAKILNGPLTVNGAAAGFVAGPATDGAAVTAHLRAAADGVTHDVWLRWYPGEEWVHGELLTVFSDRSPRLSVEVSADLRAGTAIVLGARGEPVKGPLLPTLQHADGQGRATPFWLVRNGAAGNPTDAASVAALAQVAAVGCRRVYPVAGQVHPRAARPDVGAALGIAESIAGTFARPALGLGPNPRSADAGEQEDQMFVRSESLKSPLAARVAYLTAMQMSCRPCQHREASGAMLDPALHPQLVLWDGAPHWHTGVSPDQLGKVGRPDRGTGGWGGPDVEHWLLNTLAVACRLTASPLLRYLLRQQAITYWLQWTTRPGYSTSQPYAARAVGYEAWNCVLLASLLPADEAAAVKARWIERWTTVIQPQLSARLADPNLGWFDARWNDARIGQGKGVLTWQESLGAWGLYTAGHAFGVPAAAGMGAAHAVKCLGLGWHVGPDAVWRTVPQMVEDAVVTMPAARMVSVERAIDADGFVVDVVPRRVSESSSFVVPDTSFNYFGMSLAVDVVCRAHTLPADVRATARSIMAQLVNPPEPRQPKDFAWLPPV